MTARIEMIAHARAMRSEGRYLRDVADELGICVSTAIAWTRGVHAVDKRKAEAVEVLKRLYSEGHPIPAIAKITGVPQSTLFDWRRKLNLPRNARTTYVTEELRARISKKLSRDPTGEMKREATRLYVEKGISTVEIAQILGVTSMTVSDWLRKAGVAVRTEPTKRTRQKLREANLGEKRWNWKGGVTPARVRLRGSLDMKVAREACFKRDDFTCRSCGQRGAELNAHHVWPFQRFPQWKFEVWNLVTLCKRCHHAFHEAAGGPVRVAIGPFFSKPREVREYPSVYRIAA